MFIFSVFKPEELSCSQSWSLLPWGTSLAEKEHNWMKHYLSSPSASAISSFFEINLSVEVQVKQATIQMKKLGVSLHTLIYNKLHSVISCFTWQSYVQIKEFSCGSIWIDVSIKRENSQLKATRGRGNFPSLSENENESHDVDLTQSIFQRKKEGCPLDYSDLEVSPRVLWLYLLVPLT